MTDESWYEIVDSTELRQGDLLLGCPVVRVGAAAYPLAAGTPSPVDVEDIDLVVLTQSCDIEQNNVDELLTAEVVDWEIVKSSGGDHLKSTKFRNALVQGNVPGYSLLAKSVDGVELPWSLADFHRLHVLRKDFVIAFTGQCGARLRLRSPYREHLSQAFARYFMRVGLPHDAKAFVEEGK